MNNLRFRKRYRRELKNNRKLEELELAFEISAAIEKAVADVSNVSDSQENEEIKIESGVHTSAATEEEDDDDVSGRTDSSEEYWENDMCLELCILKFILAPDFF